MNFLQHRLILAITGATGTLYGVRLLEVLRESGIQTHLIISEAGALSLHQESKLHRKDVEALAHTVYAVRDVGAAIASGSFLSDGMIIAPCSMKTLAAIAQGFSDNLISRAAEVVLKERRRLVLMVRETPLHLAHLRNMTHVTKMGGIIFPPLPAFYHHPQSIEDMVDHTVGRVLDLYAISHQLVPQWQGIKASATALSAHDSLTTDH